MKLRRTSEKLRKILRSFENRAPDTDAMFEVVEISDACFVHFLLQNAPYALVNWV